MAKSVYLYCIKHPDIDSKNSDLMIRIKDIFDASYRRYGVRRISATLRNEGKRISRESGGL